MSTTILKNIWISHIPKNGGVFIRRNLFSNYDKLSGLLDGRVHITKNRLQYDAYVERKNNHVPFLDQDRLTDFTTFPQIRTGHENPIFNEIINNWVKIIIIREPISRFLSTFNYKKWHIWEKTRKIFIDDIDTYIDTHLTKQTPSKEWERLERISMLSRTRITLKYESQLTWLMSKQKSYNLITNIDFKKFDYILDISKISIVKEIIENIYKIKLKWDSFPENTSSKAINNLNSSQNIISFKTISKLTNDQIKRIKEIPEIQKDIIFYNEMKEASDY